MHVAGALSESLITELIGMFLILYYPIAILLGGINI